MTSGSQAAMSLTKSHSPSLGDGVDEPVDDLADPVAPGPGPVGG